MVQSPRKGKNPFEFLAEDVQCENEFSQVNLSHKAEKSQQSQPSRLSELSGQGGRAQSWICQRSQGEHAQGGTAEHTGVSIQNNQ